MALRMLDPDMDDDVTNADPADLDSRILSRCLWIEKTFDKYSQRREKELNGLLRIDKALIGYAVVAYFHDIERVKTFHGMSKADHFKIAAYTVKWLCKVKPIQLTRNNSSLLDSRVGRLVLTVNADFALMLGFILSDVKLSLVKDVHKELLYTCTYRGIEPGILAQMFRQSHMLAPQRPDRNTRTAARIAARGMTAARAG